MAENKTQLKTIETFQREEQLPDAIFEGMKAANNWRTGRQVTEEEFVKAKADFLQGLIDGRIQEVKG